MLYQSAIQNKIFINPTIFPYYGQAISTEYEMPCRYITSRDITHVSLLHGHVPECIYGLFVSLCACLLYRASRSFDHYFMVYLSMNRRTKITGLSILVLAQVVLFVIVYLATIALGCGLVYLAFHASIWIIPPFFENVAPEILRLGKLGVLLLVGIIIGIVGLWAFIVSIGVYLIKPLFIFPKRDKHYGQEIKREDSPGLFDMIMETAEATGVRKPKHIYVNHEVNACVFFNTGFWNIFLPVRKNLAIGLGLFESTNAEEVKSIIAHEFGHFAQSSMRVGSVLYITNKVISDLAYRRDKLDSLLLRWCIQDGVWGFWGKATQSVVIKFRELVDYMFRMQQRNYMKLSRQMEYDADAVACKIVGTETFISALCKVQRLSKSFDFYNRVLGNFSNQHQTIADYWKGYQMTQPSMSVMDMKMTSYKEDVFTPEIESAKSRVSIEEVWESHPSLEKRIKHANTLGIINENVKTKIPAWNLISQRLKEDISSRLIKQITDNDASISIIDWGEYSEILSQKIEASFFPKDVEVFFNRNLLPVTDSFPEVNPLTDDNRALILEYEQALRDKDLLSLLNEGKIPVKYFIYNELAYSIENVPIAEHESYVDGLRNKVAEIDTAIKHYAMVNAEEGALIEAAYNAIEYGQSITAKLQSDFLPVREDMIKELNEAKIAGEDDLDSIRGWLDSYETALKDMLKNLKFRQIIPFMSKDEHEHIIGFLDASRSFISGINSDAINHMFAVTDWILRVHNDLIHSAKMVIAFALLKKELPDTKFLTAWVHPKVESCNNEDPSSEDKERVVIDSAYGKLELVVPSDEEIDTVYYQEWFRCRMWEKYDCLEKGHRFDYSLVATVPFREDGGRLSCVRPEDEEKFLVETQEYYRFIEMNLQEPDWSEISEAADHGSAHANSRMAELYLSQSRYNMAFEAAMKGALEGDVDGMVMLGILESTGEECHPELAVQLFKCAAVGGNMHALCNLGLRFAKGDGVEQDEAKAIRLFERAAFQGNSFAQNNVGYMYLNGKGANQDSERGLYWLYKAANNGYKDAVNTIWLYHKSVGNTEEYIKVVRWGAEHEIEECLREIDLINMLGTQSTYQVLNYDVSVHNPTPVYDTTVGQGLCPVCGKPIPPHTTTCPHCKEIIWEN